MLKNSGIGVGLPDTGRIILEVRDGVFASVLAQLVSVKVWLLWLLKFFVKQLV